MGHSLDAASNHFFVPSRLTLETRSCEMHTNLRKMMVSTAVVVGMATAGAGIVALPAGAATTFETMPIWRLQVRITTGNSYFGTPGTNGIPAVRLNSTSDGVRVLNPPDSTSFDRGHVDTYDLRLLDTPSAITMLRVGIAGNDDWCIKDVSLIINNRLAFAGDAVPDSEGCKTIGPGTYVEFSSTDLRTNSAWVNYGTPPALPTRLAAVDLLAMVRSATGSAMTATPGVYWDSANPLKLATKTSRSIKVAYGIQVFDPAGIESPFKATITYDVRFFVAADGQLHALKENASCCYHGTMSDAVVTQLDKALSRMTAMPLPHLPLTFAVDAVTNISWSYALVVASA
jgi:hypothetical protein